MNASPKPQEGPNFLAIAPLERGWWHVLVYDRPGMRIPFDAVSGIAPERALDTPTYAIDASTAERGADGLYLVASGCLIDVSKLRKLLEAVHASGNSKDDISTSDLTASGAIIELTQNSKFRLPSQEVGKPITISGDRGQMMSPESRAPIRRIEADLRPYGVRTAEEAMQFAGRLGIAALGIKVKDGVPITDGDMGGTPMTRVARELNYALNPVEVQEKMRRPLNKDEVIDELRKFIASKTDALKS